MKSLPCRAWRRHMLAGPVHPDRPPSRACLRGSFWSSGRQCISLNRAFRAGRWSALQSTASTRYFFNATKSMPGAPVIRSWFHERPVAWQAILPARLPDRRHPSRPIFTLADIPCNFCGVQEIRLPAISLPMRDGLCFTHGLGSATASRPQTILGFTHVRSPPWRVSAAVLWGSFGCPFFRSGPARGQLFQIYKDQDMSIRRHRSSWLTGIDNKSRQTRRAPQAHCMQQQPVRKPFAVPAYIMARCFFSRF